MEKVLKVRKPSMRKKVLMTTFMVSFLLIPFLIHAEVYKWIDDKGTIHFTDDYSNIPEKYLPSAEPQKSPQESPKESSAPIPKEKSAPVLASKSPEPLVDATPRLFSGVISTVDAGMIVVTGEGNDMVFLISGDTKIVTDEGKEVPFDGLKAEMSVTVEYERNGDEIHALSVRISNMSKGVATRQKGHK